METIHPVRLPLSSGRSDKNTWAKLIRKVRFPPRSGFDFEGLLMKPGAIVSFAELQQDGYPQIPLILECAGIAKAGRGHNRSEYLYLLWQYDTSRKNWVELGRARSFNWDWAVDLASLAHHAIEEQHDPLDLDQAAARIRAYLDSELERFPEPHQVLGLIHDEIAGRIFS